MSDVEVKIDDAAWQKLQAELLELGRKYVKVGVLSESGTYVDGNISIVGVAAVHEFGDPATSERPWTIPERSFIRRTFIENQDELAAFTGELAGKVVQHALGRGGYGEDKALDLLGQWGVSRIRRTITAGAGVPPPLARSTVENKGSSRPLVDTERLLGAISYEVKSGGEGE